jgi:hypothetical protein
MPRKSTRRDLHVVNRAVNASDSHVRPRLVQAKGVVVQFLSALRFLEAPSSLAGWATIADNLVNNMLVLSSSAVW